MAQPALSCGYGNGFVIGLVQESDGLAQGSIQEKILEKGSDYGRIHGIQFIAPGSTAVTKRNWPFGGSRMEHEDGDPVGLQPLLSGAAFGAKICPAIQDNSLDGAGMVGEGSPAGLGSLVEVNGICPCLDQGGGIGGVGGVAVAHNISHGSILDKL
jgi:hypothetical protein